MEELFIEFLRYAKPQFTPKAIEQRTHLINKAFAFGSAEDAEHADKRHSRRRSRGTPLDLVDKERRAQLDCQRDRLRFTEPRRTP